MTATFVVDDPEAGYHSSRIQNSGPVLGCRY